MIVAKSRLFPCLRPQSRIYATQMSYDPEIGLVTDSKTPTIVVAFSEEVTGFDDHKIKVLKSTLCCQPL